MPKSLISPPPGHKLAGPNHPIFEHLDIKTGYHYVSVKQPFGLRKEDKVPYRVCDAVDHYPQSQTHGHSDNIVSDIKELTSQK